MKEKGKLWEHVYTMQVYWLKKKGRNCKQGVNKMASGAALGGTADGVTFLFPALFNQCFHAECDGLPLGR